MIEINPHLGLPLDEFIRVNEKLIHSVCARYRKYLQGPHSISVVGDYGDLFNIASIGLIKAYKGFDPTKVPMANGQQVKFSTYGVPMMVGEVRRYLRDSNITMKFSRSVKENYYKLRATDIPFEDTQGLVAALDMSIKEVEDAQAYARSMYSTSMDDVVFENDGDPITYGDQLSADPVDYTSGMILEEFYKTLSYRERDVFELHKRGLTQSEIGIEIGVTQVQISRVIKRIYQKAEAYGRDKSERKFSHRAG